MTAEKTSSVFWLHWWWAEGDFMLIMHYRSASILKGGLLWVPYHETYTLLQVLNHPSKEWYLLGLYYLWRVRSIYRISHNRPSIRYFLQHFSWEPLQSPHPAAFQGKVQNLNKCVRATVPGVMPGPILQPDLFPRCCTDFSAALRRQIQAQGLTSDMVPVEWTVSVHRESQI